MVKFNKSTLEELVTDMEFNTSCSFMEDDRKILELMIGDPVMIRCEVKTDVESMVIKDTKYNLELQKLNNLKEVEKYLQVKYNRYYMNVLTYVASNKLDKLSDSYNI